MEDRKEDTKDTDEGLFDMILFHSYLSLHFRLAGGGEGGTVHTSIFSLFLYSSLDSALQHGW